MRPLLGLEHVALTHFLNEEKVAWLEDPSNQNREFARIRIRKSLAENASARLSLDTTATQEGGARQARDHALAETAARLVILHPLGYAELPHAGWRALPEALSAQLLADLLTTVSGAFRRPRRHETLRLAQELRVGKEMRRTLHACEISLDQGMLRIVREPARCAAPLTLQGEGSLRWDNRFEVHFALPPGYCLTLRALGEGRKQCAARDLPAATPSLWHLDQLVFLPHMASEMNLLPRGSRLRIGFAPAKPLAAAPFWWLNSPQHSPN